MAETTNDLRIALDDTAERVANFLASKLSPGSGFPGREFYGLAFSIWLWSTFNDRFKTQINDALTLIQRDDRKQTHPQYHWEFVRFGLGEALAEGAAPGTSVRDVLGKERFVGTRVANWTLLRANVRLRSRSLLQRVIGHIESLAVLLILQTKDGFIEDQRDRPTQQYHAFSAALLGLRLEQKGAFQRIYRRAFAKAVSALDGLTLKGGEMNFVGRGQAQTFGYASAVLAFCLAARHLGDANYLSRARDVFSRVRHFIRDDGALPLVLRDGEDASSGEARTPFDTRFLGWYSHNNFYDYLPFTAALLRRSARVLSELPDQILARAAPQLTGENRIDDFLVVSRPRYRAVVLSPKSYLPSNQPIPFLEVEGRYPLPCYGGEMQPPGLYTAFGLPLPVLIGSDGTRHTLAEAHFRWTSPHVFEGRHSLFALKRSFSFADNSFSIEDEVSVADRCGGWRLAVPRIPLPQDSSIQMSRTRLAVPGVVIESDVPLSREDAPQYCALGALWVYSGNIAVIPKGKHFFARSRITITPELMEAAQ